MSNFQPKPFFSFEPASLARLMPMYIAVDGQGLITAVGTTMAKIFQSDTLIGKEFLHVFDVRRPAGIVTSESLLRQVSERLKLTARSQPGLSFRGLGMPIVGQGALINLSFGIGVIDAVREHHLTEADFAQTDLAVELLYLVEAKTAVLDALRNLNLRLDGAKKVAESQALTDPLTGLRNRRALDQILQKFEQRKADFSLMHLDLDYFKQVNDTFGHAAGDHILKTFANVLTRVTRSSDFVARVGGDEFVVVLPQKREMALLEKIAERIISEISMPIEYDGNLCRVSSSIGITCTQFYQVPNLSDMMVDVDDALYASKKAGRARASFAVGDRAM
ncbi:MAG: hypothetical protein RIR95_2227 [Pseudomonadota bacterium]